MRAIVCEKLGLPSDLVMRELPDSHEPGPGEIKVALSARGAQFVDVLMAAGEYQTKPPLPFIPGGEAAGEIVAVGSEVDKFKVGDKVMTRHSTGAFAEKKGFIVTICARSAENFGILHYFGPEFC